MSIKKYNPDKQQWEYITPTKQEYDTHVEVIASTSVLGHVMVDGTSITIDRDGKISVVNQGTGGSTITSVPDATTLAKGIVQLSSEIASDSEVFAATPKAVKEAVEAAKTFATEKLAELIGSAPDTLNTLQELAAEAQKTDSALQGAISTIGNKADQSALDTHTQNQDIHITNEEREKWNNGSKIHVSAVEPANKDLLWISTNV